MEGGLGLLLNLLNADVSIRPSEDVIEKVH